MSTVSVGLVRLHRYFNGLPGDFQGDLTLKEGVDEWLEINARFADLWPNISEAGEVPADADEWKGAPNKITLLSEEAFDG